MMNSNFSFTTTSYVASVFAYGSLVYLFRHRSWYRLEKMPPPTTVDEAYLILYNMLVYDYPLFTNLSLELGFLKTYAVPSISRILAGSHQLVSSAPKRIDDTGLIMREMIENSPSSDRSRNAIRRMNYLHSKYKNITNADYLYVLAIFICEPIRFAEKYGYRGAHAHERLSSFLVFRHIGKEMGIRELFDSYDEAEQYMLSYEDENFRFASTNKTVADASVEVELSLFPKIFHGYIKNVLYTLCAPKLREALGFPNPSTWVMQCVYCGFNMAKWTVKYFFFPRFSAFHRRRTNFNMLSTGVCPFSGTSTSSTNLEEENTSALIGPPYFNPYCAAQYPEGYRIEDVGPSNFSGKIGLLHSEK